MRTSNIKTLPPYDVLKRRSQLFVLGALLLTACSQVQTFPTPTLSFHAPTMESPGAEATLVPFSTTIFKINGLESASESRLEDARPNVIVILTDDQPFHTTIYMPTVREVLLEGGVNFVNGFVTTPLCCPSRASILTGEYAHNHRVLTNLPPSGGAPAFDASSTLATWLQASGYRTGFFGKYLNDYEELTPRGVVPGGWDEWSVFLSRASQDFYSNFSLSANGQIMRAARTKNEFSADVLTKQALAFIRDAREGPFLLFVSYFNPHRPFLSAERHANQFSDLGELEAQTYVSANFMENDISDKPAFMQTIKSPHVDQVNLTFNNILRSLLSVDDGVASILRVLEKTGLSDNTIIIFLSDNGFTVGNHRLGLTKGCVYDECARVPFIVYAPALFSARSEARLVANIDIAPTIAELAGLPIPAEVDGFSLVPLLMDPNTPWRDSILLEYWKTEGDDGGSRKPGFAAVRTAHWKYVEYETGETELYDLVNDPDELVNLAGLAEHAGLMIELDRTLEALKLE